MRVLTAILTALFCLGVAFASPAAPPTTALSAPMNANVAPTSAATSSVAGGLRALKRSYRAHRAGFATASKYSENLRHQRWLALGAIVIFAFLTLPRSVRSARAFYRQMISASPLHDLPDVSADNVQRARAVLFFYLLFLLYQIVSFPLTLGRDDIVQFSADLFFQAAILLALVWTYQRLKGNLRAEWRDNPERREKMDLWLNEKLDGMNIRWKDIRKLALGVFAAGFAPVTVAHLPNWLDGLAAIGDKLVGT